MRANVLAAAVLLLAASPSIVSAQLLAQVSPVDFPAAPVRIFVPFPAGGPADVIMRILGDRLAVRWGKPVIVENRPGASTIVSTTALANSQPDGYTLGDATQFHVITPALNRSLPFDTVKDFSGVSMVVLQSIVLVAHPSFPPNTLAELIALAKSKPGELDFTSSGPRGVGHLAGEMLKHLAGVQMQHINYNGSGPALTDVLAGRVPIMFDIWHSVKQQVADGRLKVIAFTGLQRQKDALQYPTIAETFPGFDATSFQAVITRAGLPPAVLDKLSADIRAVVASPEFRDRTQHLGVDPIGSTPAEADRYLHGEIKKWQDIVAKANLKID
jgi:tripartite-type tricarboxylate transporter receptor subunit TctC